MHSCTSPAGRLKSHQRGFWIETPFQMQKTKALRWLFPECVRRVEKYNTIRQAYSYFWGVHAQEIPGGKPEIWLDLAHQISAAWPCHRWDSSRWLPAHLSLSQKVFLWYMYIHYFKYKNNCWHLVNSPELCLIPVHLFLARTSHSVHFSSEKSWSWKSFSKEPKWLS